MERVAAVNGADPADIDPNQSFAALGLTSSEAVALTGKIENFLSIEVSPLSVFEYPTPAALAAFLAGSVGAAPASGSVTSARGRPSRRHEGPVAVVGLACRLPGAPDAESFRDLLRRGAVVAAPPPASRRNEGWETDPPAGFLAEVDRFDERFFGISAGEAADMDPQQRLALEVAWESLESAGISPGSLAGTRTGVWFGVCGSDYALLRAAAGGAPGAYVAIGNAHSIVANRISYLLDLHGPSIAVDTACSSSLMAVHLACGSLLARECDLALAGGVNLLLYPQVTRSLAAAGMLAPDGLCKAFDAAADGYGRGEGCGVVVLKRLADAQADGDEVLAIVAGSAVVQDGATNGLSAPSRGAQCRTLREALAAAAIDPRDVSYMEAHGTGTPLGDPIEFAAFADVLGEGRSLDRPCRVGTVKANIGHLEAAAGIASFIKVVLSLHHGEILPHPLLRSTNPALRCDGMPFRFPAAPEPWPVDQPRVAGVSSFGFGGTNVHAVLAAVETAGAFAAFEAPAHLLCLSAKTPDALRELAMRHASHLTAHQHLAPEDVCYTLGVGRNHFGVRLAVRGDGLKVLADGLDAFATGRPHEGVTSGTVARGGAGPSPALPLPGPNDTRAGWDQALTDLAQHYVQGGAIDWAALYGRRRRLSLPTYPFQRRRHWINMNPFEAPSLVTAPAASAERRIAIVDNLRAATAKLLGRAPEELDPAAPFLEFGADSIVLLTAVRTIHDMYGVQLSIRELFEDYVSIEAVATRIEHLLRSELAAPAVPPLLPVGATPPQAASIADRTTEPPAARGDALERVIQRQLEVMSEQIAALRGSSPALASASTVPRIAPGAAVPIARASSDARAAPALPLVSPLPSFRPKDRSAGHYTSEQRAWLADFTHRYNARTAGSKSIAQRHRATLADNRAVAGLRLATKELLYPIVATRSAGSRFWDVDGNEYVDLTMGFGVNLFGHNPDFVRRALEAQIAQGIQIGPQSPLSGRVAEMIRELTGKDRVCFVNSGTEAVMTALRIVRAATGRSKIVLFSGSYHGTFDGVLARASTLGTDAPVPLSPGVLPGMIGDVVVLDYDDRRSLDWIAAHVDELAGVLVEPVQSRSPELQPREFVHELRRITRNSGAVLIFDEVLTGFRSHPRGAQGWYGVDADIATYGKIIGGGMPIGVVAGRADIMDFVDGGQWTFGDGSMPHDIETAFFSGTFCKHPLSMVAAEAVLEELKRRGPELQMALNRTTERLAGRLNALFHDSGVPARMVHFGSLFRFKYPGDLELLYYQLICRGVYVWEARNCFLSVAHGEDDFDRVYEAFRGGIAELRSVGLLGEGITARPVPAAAKAAVATPTTEGQRQLWLFAQMSEEASAAYNESLVIELTGALRPAVLARAVHQVFARHEATRAAIALDGMSQSVSPSTAFELPIVDLRGGGGPAEEQANSWLAADLRRPFQLDRAPLVRPALLTLRDDVHWFVIVAHHAMLDGWSLGVLLTEVAALYTAEVLGDPVTLPAAAQFRDHVRSEADYTGSSAFARDEQYWRGVFADGVPSPVAPGSRPRVEAAALSGGRCSLWIDGALHDAVVRSGRRHGCTPFIMLWAAMALLMHRLGGQEDLVIGVPVSTRRDPDAERLVGYCTNMLPVRSRCPSGISLSRFLETSRGTLSGALDHARFPFAAIVRTLNPHRQAGRMPIVNVSFNLERRVDLPVMGDLAMSVRTPPLPFAKLDLHLNATAIGDALRLDLDYDTALFDDVTAERLLGAYKTLLGRLATSPDARVSDLPLLDAAEWEHRIIAWNRTAAPFPAETVLPRLIESRAVMAPNATAVISADEQLSFRQLDRRANHLAHRLAGMGVAADSRVAICLPRRPDLIVALLAVLKAAGAFVPLDPADPAARRAALAADSGALVVITTTLLAGAFGALPVRLLRLDGTEEEAEAPPPAAVTPDHLAYVIYTSGSTGSPKGVMATHRGLLNYLHWAVGYYRVGEGRGAALHSTVAFDLTVTTLFAPLLAGRAIALAPAGQAGLEALYGAFDLGGGFSFLKLTPAHLEFLAREPPAAGLAGQAAGLIVGGDQLLNEAIEPWRATATRVTNEYGPTETVVGCCVYDVRSDDPHHGVVPIGRPVANTRLYVLDPFMQPVPAGFAGEIYVGGMGVARGYLNLPAATAERFVPDPFSGEAGARLYRTGDVARLRPDDLLEYLGRVDRQVKVRGHRVELAEIEAVLAEHPSVAQAAVVASGDGGEFRIAAHVVAAGSPLPAPADLRRFLELRLPAAMLPHVITLLPELPLTRNGKVDHDALAKSTSAMSAVREDANGDVLERIVAGWRAVLGVDAVGQHDNFFDLGGHSLQLPALRDRVAAALGRPVSLLDLFRHPTAASQARHLAATDPVLPAVAPASAGGDVAIIGMACRVPGAFGLDAFQANLEAGRVSIATFDDRQLRAAGVRPDQSKDPHYVARGGVLEGVDLIDAEFFAFTPREAELTDPQHRVFLECAWEALEDAGIDPRQCGHSVGVFAGAAMNTYLLFNLMRNRRVLASVDERTLALASDKDFLSTRVAYKLDLRGPSVTVQTACSTSLVAVHTACRSLRAGECDVALAGGVAVRLPQEAGYLWQEGGIESPDGRCRAFDADAAGTVFGNGAGAVVLKRFDAARADGDFIYAVIKGSAVNNDGAGKLGFTAPQIDGQAAVIRAALRDARVDAGSIGYLEAHGTGTHLGDQVELAAIGAALGQEGEPCLIGSVKANVGHLDTAAGVVGLIKASLALTHRRIPPQPGFRAPLPDSALDRGRFYVATRPRPWDHAGPRRAGVSSFGIGGTNAHVVLEEAPPAAARADDERPAALLVLSAMSAPALETMTDRLADHLDAHPDLRLSDVAHSLLVGRRRFAHRRMLVSTDLAEAVQLLRSPDQRRLLDRHTSEDHRPVAFLFPGQGAQAPGMGRKLYLAEPAFRTVFDRCADQLRTELGLDLRDLLFRTDDAAAATARLADTAVAQPALFAIEYALARLWISWGIEPAWMAGHSIGEYVAACLAEVLTPDDALSLVAARGRLMAHAPAGAMLAVALGEPALRAQLPADLDIAAVNAPDQCIVAGPLGSVKQLATTLTAAGVPSRTLQTSHAFHSALMEPVLQQFRGKVAAIRLQAPRRRYLSNVTGDWISDAEATSPDYWVHHLRHTVRFDASLGRLLQERPMAVLEVGPGRALAALARRRNGTAGKHVPVASLERPGESDEAGQIAGALGQLWSSGVAVDAVAVNAGRSRRVPLPSYPFQRRRHWIEPDAKRAADTSSWRVLRPAWRPAPRPAPATAPRRWIVLGDDPLARAVISHIAGMPGQMVVTAFTGDGIGEDRVVDMRGDAARLLDLARILADRAAPVHLDVVTRDAEAVLDEERPDPAAAAAAGVALTIPQELAHVSRRHIDLPAGDAIGLARTLVDELLAEPDAATVALRTDGRRLLAFEPWSADAASLLRPQGVYLITGGFGRIGLRLAEELAGTMQARLVLLGREAAAEAVRDRLDALAARCGEIATVYGNVADPATMRNAVTRARERFGGIDGVFHCAGVTGTASVAELGETTEHLLERHAAPKLRGMEAIAAVAVEHRLGFVAVFSSLAAILGGVGFAAYTAANRACDALATRLDRRDGTRWIAIDWDAWRFAGQADGGAEFAVRDDDGIAALFALLTADVPSRLVVANGDLEARRARWAGPRCAAMAGIPVPRAATPAGIGQTETVLAEILTVWRDVLGVAAVHPDSDFFGLGGDSLAALRVAAALRERLGVRVALSQLMAAPTPSRLARALAPMRDAADAAIVPVPRVGPLPLSFAQLRLWASDQITADGTAFVLVNAIDLAGTLDVAALRRGVAEVVSRHEVLHTRFVIRDGEPAQVAVPVDAPSLPVIDLRAVAPGQREARARGVAMELAGQRLDLARDPPLRTTLLRIADDRHWLVVIMHHVVADGWSTAIFADELSALYAAQISGRPAALPPLPLQYADVAMHQRQKLQGPALDALIAFWQARMAGAPPVLDLAPRRARRQAPVSSAALAVNIPIASVVAEVARVESVTPFMVLLGAFAVLLHARTGRTDIVIGTDVAGRDLPGTDRLIGFFINLLPLRCDLSGDPDFRTLLQRIREMAVGVFAHQELPFEQMVAALRPAREPHVPPVFQVKIVLQNVPAAVLNLPGLESRPVALDRGTDRLDIVLNLADMNGAFVGLWEYDPSRFEAADIQALQTQFAAILDRITADREQRLSALLAGSSARAPALPPFDPRCAAAEAGARTRVAVALHAGTAARLFAAGAGDDVSAGLLLAAWHTLLSRHAGVPVETIAVSLDGGAYLDVAVGDAAGSTLEALALRLSTPLAAARSGDGAAASAAAAFAYGAAATASARTFAMMLVAMRSGDGFVLTINYDSERLSAAEAECLADQLAALLTDAAQHPERPTRELSPVEPAIKACMLELAVGPHAGPPSMRLDTLVARKAAERPNTIAVVCGERSVDYATLDRLAAGVAARLRALGVGTDDVVGVGADDGVDMLVAILGVLKAGGAYLPLDPGYPPARLALMVKDSGAGIVVAPRRLLHGVLGGLGAASLALEDVRFDMPGTPAAAPAGSAHLDSLAYVIFTSGSTGRPKGVGVTHANAVQSTLARLAAYGGAPPTFLLLSPFSFDSSVAGLFWTLAAGGTLVVVDAATRTNVAGIAALIERHRVSHTLCLPSLYAQLLEQAPPRVLERLSLVVVAGETCPTGMPTRHRATASRVALYNEYGRTEATVWCTFAEIGRSDVQAGIPIGRPIQGARVHVLDAFLEPVPPGVAGELYIGGEGVARGYLNRPAETAERFTPDPFSAVFGARLYRTGDRARVLPDGTIQFLGRLDAMVKIRGHRVEPAEVETTLALHPAVAASAVVVSSDPVVGRRLVAFVVARHGTALEGADLQAYLCDRLPEPMVPSLIRIVSALPVTPSGKIDRLALAERAKHDRAAEPQAMAASPQSPAEQALAHIWAQVLGVHQISRAANFFQLGGDSILAIQIAARAQSAGFAVTARGILERPVLADLAAAAGTPKDTLPAGQGIVVGPAPVTPIQRWFLADDPVDPHHFLQALVLMPGRPVDGGLLAAAATRLLEHHDALRHRFRRGPLGWEQIAEDLGGPGPFVEIDLSATPASERAAVLRRALDAQVAALDPQAGSMLRVARFTFGDDVPERILIIVHHLVIDGVSWRILLEDFVALLEDRAVGTEAILPSKTVAFRDWARCLVERADAVAPAAEAGWWLDQPWERAVRLAGAGGGSHAGESDAATVAVELSLAETRALLQELPWAYRAGVEDILLASLARMVALETDGEALAVELEHHGRDGAGQGIDVSRTVGWFTTAFPVLLDLPRGGDPESWVAAVKAMRSAVPRNGFAFLPLLQGCAGEDIARRLAALPARDVLFNYLGRFDMPASSLDMRLAPEEPPPGRSSRATLRWPLEVTAHVMSGRLRVEWRYARGRFGHSNVSRMAARFATVLRALINPNGAADERDRLTERFGPIAAAYPLNPMQQGILVDALRFPKSGAYVVQVTGLLRGPFDQDAFVEAWRTVVARHEALRSRFVWDASSGPLQIVLAKTDLPVAAHDRSGLAPDSERRRQAAAIMAEDRSRGFDMNSGPLLRLTLVRIGDDEWRFAVTHHHLVLDGWSLAIIVREVLACYGARIDDSPAALPPAPLLHPYAEWLEQQNSAPAEAFWRNALADFEAPIPLEPNGGDGAGFEDLEAVLSVAATNALAALARRLDVTPNTLVQGAWALALGARMDVVTFGTTVAGRPAELPQMDAMVGQFMNVLPFRVPLPADAILGDWLVGLQVRFTELRTHEATPLALIQAWCGERLFDSVLVYENYPAPQSFDSLPGGLEIVELDSIERSDRAVVVMAVPGPQLRLRLTYDRARAGDATAAALLSRLVRNLERQPDEIDQRLDAVRAEADGSASASEVERFNEAL
jgi:amino acid adenylation domain-containing protein/non-ribosomal peptide synthase protein (TIGR01720 family)